MNTTCTQTEYTNGENKRQTLFSSLPDTTYFVYLFVNISSSSAKVVLNYANYISQGYHGMISLGIEMSLWDYIAFISHA
jgi:hypothetical protein